jgi:hypothetical protein
MNIKDIFGKPNEGIHSQRIGPFASVDIFLTIIGSILLAILFKKSFLNVFLILFIIGQILHFAFGVETAFIKMLEKPNIIDLIVSFIIGIIIGLLCGFSPITTGIIIVILNLGFNIFIFHKITNKITDFIMST